MKAVRSIEWLPRCMSQYDCFRGNGDEAPKLYCSYRYSLALVLARVIHRAIKTFSERQNRYFSRR